MSSDLIIDVTPSEVVIALLEDKRLVELTREKSDVRFTVGDIYLAKVKKIMPSLNAAFVDVGYEKDAFLHYLDLGPQFSTLTKFIKVASSSKNRISSLSKIQSDPDIDKDGKIADLLKVGQNILVQIAKEPISTKGPRLTSELSVAGRNLVLMPFSERVSVSQKISPVEEKNRLKKLIQSIKPKKYGVIVRTVSEGKRVAELDQELKKLVVRFETTFQKLKKVSAPSLIIGEMSRTTAILRDIYNPNFNSIIVNDADVADEVADYIDTIAPENKKTVKCYKGGQPIFDHFGINKQVKSLFGKTVSFKNGAYLIIEHTEAFHVIDVNSGNRSKVGVDQETNALEVNMAAAYEIARQLRLRDMGGIIVIDFIDMQNAENRQKVYERVKEVMAADRSKHNILQLSKFCLMQITRQRVRPEEHVETAEVCPTCNGSGKITPSILFTDELEVKVDYIFKDLMKKKLTLKVHPYTAAFLNLGFFSLRRKWALRHFKSIKVEGVNSYGFLEYHFYDENNEEIIL